MTYTSTKQKRIVSKQFQERHTDVFKEMQKRRTNRLRTIYDDEHGNHFVKIFGDWWQVKFATSPGRCWLMKKAKKTNLLTSFEFSDMTEYLIEQGMCGYEEEEMMEMMREFLSTKVTSDKYVTRYEVTEEQLAYYCGVISSATEYGNEDGAWEFHSEWVPELPEVEAKPRPKKRMPKKVEPKAPEVDTNWGYVGDPKSKPHEVYVYEDEDDLALCEWHGAMPNRTVPSGTRVKYGEIVYDGRHDDEWYWEVTFKDGTAGIVYRENCYLDNDERKEVE